LDTVAVDSLDTVAVEHWMLLTSRILGYTMFTRGVLLGFTMVLGLTPCHACDVISALSEFMVGVAGVDALPCV
jgi:hypothetical protein